MSKFKSLIDLTFYYSERQRAFHVEGVIHCWDSLCTYRGRCACLPIMHSTALTYLPGTANLNTLCSDDVTYPDHVVPPDDIQMHVREWSIRIPKRDITLPWHLTFYLKHFATGFF